MVRIIVAIALALSALAGGTAYASQASLPGDALYSVKIGTEQVGMMLPGDDAGRAERALNFAERRVREMEALAEEGRWEHLGLAGGKYEYALNMTLARMEQATDQALAAGNVTARVAEATWRHMEVLGRIYDDVPEQAKPAIARAMEVSQRGHAAALGALERVRLHGSQEPGPPEGVTPGPPEGVPAGP